MFFGNKTGKYPPSLKGESLATEPIEFCFDMLENIYKADSIYSTTTSFWMDKLLERRGKDPSAEGTCGGLMSRGRAFYMNYHDASIIGFGGEAAYIEESESDFGFYSKTKKNAFEITFSNGTPVENTAFRVDCPSHWKSEYTLADIYINTVKFITENNCAIALLDITNKGHEKTEFVMNASSPFASTKCSDELWGTFKDPFGNTEITAMFSGSGMQAKENSLVSEIELNPEECISLKFIMGFITQDIPESEHEYLDYKNKSGQRTLQEHISKYNKWWSENVPYFDTEDESLKKTYYYEWWKLRFNLLDANTKRNYSYPTLTEGCLGYNNAITLSVPWHIDDLKYLKSPVYAYGTWQSVAETAKNGLFISNPGDPKHWPEWNIANYISKAGWDAYKVHGGPKDFLGYLAYSGEKDVYANLRDSAKDGGYVLGKQYDGWDFDTLSNIYSDNQKRLDSTAYTWVNAIATAEMYEYLEEYKKASQVSEISEKMLQASLNEFWDEKTSQFLQKTESSEFVPWRDINNYYIWAVGMVPEAETKYLNALKPWANEDEFPVWPMLVCNLKDYKIAKETGKEITLNYGFGNIGITLKLFANAIKKYKSRYITQEHFARLIKWASWAHYVDGDIRYPDTNEFFRGWDGKKIECRSWIHHNALGRFNASIIEDAVGITPRIDDLIELNPIDIGLKRFVLQNLNYHGRKVSVYWQSKDSNAKYPGIPDGYSLYIDNIRAMTADKICSVIWNPADGKTVTKGNEIIYSRAYDKSFSLKDVKTFDNKTQLLFNKAKRRSSKLMPPATPGKIFASVSSCTQTDIFWSTSLGTKEYILEADGNEIMNAKSPYEFICNTPGTKHDFRVKAKNDIGESQWSCKIDVCLPDKKGINIAEYAKVTVSEKCTSSWHSVSGINDGCDPKQKAEYGHKPYCAKSGTGRITVQFDWEYDVQIFSSEMFWFDDGLDVFVPEKCDIFCRKEDKWISCGQIENKKGEYNINEIDSFVTRSIMIDIEHNKDFSVGIQEWKVFGEKHITNILSKERKQ